MTITIYFDPSLKNFQVIRPIGEEKGRGRTAFEGSVSDLVDTITGSQPMRGIKNYHSWKVD